jgi:hypothetical protein
MDCILAISIKIFFCVLKLDSNCIIICYECSFCPMLQDSVTRVPHIWLHESLAMLRAYWQKLVHSCPQQLYFLFAIVLYELHCHSTWQQKTLTYFNWGKEIISIVFTLLNSSGSCNCCLIPSISVLYRTT